jgi:hypothetical protein
MVSIATLGGVDHPGEFKACQSLGCFESQGAGLGEATEDEKALSLWQAQTLNSFNPSGIFLRTLGVL